MMQLRSNTLTKLKRKTFCQMELVEINRMTQLKSNTITVRYYIFKRIKLLFDDTNAK